MATQSDNRNIDTSWFGEFARGARDWLTGGQMPRSGRAAQRQPPVGELSARPVYAPSSSDDEPNPWRDGRDTWGGRAGSPREGVRTPVHFPNHPPDRYSTPHGPYGRIPPTYRYDARPPTAPRFHTPVPLEPSFANQTYDEFEPRTAAPRYYDMATGRESYIPFTRNDGREDAPPPVPPKPEAWTRAARANTTHRRPTFVQADTPPPAPYAPPPTPYAPPPAQYAPPPAPMYAPYVQQNVATYPAPPPAMFGAADIGSVVLGVMAAHTPFTLGKFAGSRYDRERAEDWIAALTRWLDTSRVFEPSMRAALVRGQTSDEPRAWIETLPPATFADWRSFETRFRQRYAVQSQRKVNSAALVNRWEGIRLAERDIGKDVDHTTSTGEVQRMAAHKAFVQDLEREVKKIDEYLAPSLIVAGVRQRLPYAFGKRLDLELQAVGQDPQSLDELAEAMWNIDIAEVTTLMREADETRAMLKRLGDLERAQAQKSGQQPRAAAQAAPSPVTLAPAPKKPPPPPPPATTTTLSEAERNMIVVPLGPFAPTTAGWAEYEKAAALHRRKYPGTRVTADMPHPISPGTLPADSTSSCWDCGRDRHGYDRAAGREKPCPNPPIRHEREVLYRKAVGNAVRRARNAAILEEGGGPPDGESETSTTVGSDSGKVDGGH